MDGTFERAGDWVVLRFERRLRHPVERVWAALTEPAELELWLATTTLDLRAGGTIEISFNHSEGHDVSYGHVTVVDAPKVLEYTWYPAQLGDSRVRWELTAEDDGGCLLVLTHRFPASYGIAETLGGWHVHMEALAAVLDGRSYDLRKAPWRDAQEIYIERYALTPLPAAASPGRE